MASTLADAGSQIGIVAVDPVLAWGIEDVEINGVFEGEGLVRNVGRNAEDFAGMDGDLFAFEGKFQCALEDVGDLLVVVAVKRDVRAFLEQDTRDHDSGADNELTADEGVELFYFNIGPSG
jgi:hypothetical protein